MGCSAESLEGGAPGHEILRLEAEEFEKRNHEDKAEDEEERNADPADEVRLGLFLVLAR